MAILKFDGADDYVRSGTLSQTYNGALSGAALLRRTSGTPAWTTIIGTHTASQMGWAFQLEWATASRLSVYNDAAAANSYSTLTINYTNTDLWVLGFTMPSGTGQVRFHAKNLTTGAATTHQNGNIATFSTVPRSSSGGYLKIGNFDNTPGAAPGSNDDDFLGDIAVAALWQGVNMSDAQFDELWANLRTSDWHTNSAGTPTLLTELTSTSPTDLEGSTTFTVGGATATGTNPAGWNFDGTGVVVTTVRATPAFQSAGTVSAAAATIVTPTNLTPGLPATRPYGSQLLCLTTCTSATPTVATPAGWTSLMNVTGTVGRIAVFSRVVDGTETGPTVTWSGLTTGTGGTPCQARIACFSNLERTGATLPVTDVAGAISNQTASTTAYAGGSAITTTIDQSLVLVLGVRTDDAGTIATLANSDGVAPWAVAFADATTSGADGHQIMQYGVKPTLGSVAAKTMTITSGVSFASAGAMLALKAQWPDVAPLTMPPPIGA